MRRLHVIGHKDHGKTSLIVALVSDLTRRGVRVGTIKHTAHRHEFDTPGKDSYEHRKAGACRAGLVSSSMCAVFWSRPHHDVDDRYEEFCSLFADCDLVLVEGDSGTTARKIEVWRKSFGSSPIATEDRSVLAIVTDDDIDAEISVLRRSDIPTLSDWILELLAIPARPS